MHALLLFLLWGELALVAWWGLLALALTLLLHAGWRWWSSPEGVLGWTGREWHWKQGRTVQACTLRWVLDFQTSALVCAHLEDGRGTKHWFWLERGAKNALAWTALRRALLCGAAKPGLEALSAQAMPVGGTTSLSGNH